MFASRPFAGFQDSGGNSLDVPVAALAGLAVAFLAFATPANLLADLVGASGLPSVVPAAEPPLGMKARLGLGAAGALLAFALAFLLLRWLGRFGSRRAEEAEELVLPETPRLRRRDIHPDAPARPPLLAVHELGEPELELAEIAAEAPTPWLEQASPVAPDLPPTVDPEPQAWSAPEPERFAAAPEESGSQADAYALSQRIWSDEPPAAEAGMNEDQAWDAEPLAREPLEPETPEQPWSAEPTIAEEPGSTDDLEPAEPEAEPEGEPEAEWQRLVETEQPWPAACAIPEPEPEPEPEADEAAHRHAPGSIADLMERLEQGLARRRLTPLSQPAPAPIERLADEPMAPHEPDNDRLQNAIDSLQRFASRQD